MNKKKIAQEKENALKIKLAGLKRNLIDELRKTVSISEGCKNAGLKTPIFYQWLKFDENFFLQASVALDLSRDGVTEEAESLIISAIRKGDIGAAKYWLKHNCGRYSPKETTHTKVSLDVNRMDFRANLPGYDPMVAMMGDWDLMETMPEDEAKVYSKFKLTELLEFFGRQLATEETEKGTNLFKALFSNLGIVPPFPS